MAEREPSFLVPIGIRIAAALLSVPATVLLGLLLHEWWHIGVVRDPEVVAGYYFGSEAMLHHGGWYYRSASAYAGNALLQAVLLTPGTSLLIHSAVSASGQSLRRGALAAAIGLLSPWVLSPLLRSIL